MLDRFVCRREGHVPTVILYRTSGIEVSAYFTTCRRCGKWFAADVTERPPLPQRESA